MGHDQSDWISRTLVSFGRYSDKRPDGLYVDRDGAFTVNNFLDSWGYAQGLSFREVMDAARANMFYDQECGELRFCIDESHNGEVRIRVNSKGQRQGSDRWSHTSWHSQGEGWHGWESRGWSASWERDRCWESGDKGRSSDETALRKLAWLCRVGYQKHGLRMEGLYLPVQAVVDIMAKESTVSSPQDFFELLRRGDAEGRFELSQNRSMVRKVPREERSKASTAPWTARPAAQSKSQSKSQSEPQSKPSMDWPCSPPTRDSRPIVKEQPQDPPEKPPGQHWTEYQDEGASWWYYDGPLGKWWSPSASEDPRPYNGD